MTASHQSGFSLPLVLLVIGALAGVSVMAALAARGHARGTAAGTGIAQAEALAEAGMALALLDLERHRPAARQGAAPAARWRHDCRIGGSTLHLARQDEGGKVDLNFADARLLAALLVGLGEPRPRAQSLADAVIDYRDADDDRLPLGAEREAYVEAGRPAGPKNARFSDIVEIRAVLGMTHDLADRIAPHVTVHSARSGIDPTVADPALVALLVRGDAEAGFTSGDSGEAPTAAAPDTPLPPQFVTPSLRRYATITVDVVGPQARVVREAIVDSATPPAAAAASAQIVSRYRFWTWRRRDGLPPAHARPAATGHLPPC